MEEQFREVIYLELSWWVESRLLGAILVSLMNDENIIQHLGSNLCQTVLKPQIVRSALVAGKQRIWYPCIWYMQLNIPCVGLDEHNIPSTARPTDKSCKECAWPWPSAGDCPCPCPWWCPWSWPWSWPCWCASCEWGGDPELPESMKKDPTQYASSQSPKISYKL